uniref:Uncharacterized protein n=1 Tax=Romanomermis culicivorax TaxID=13658 RepID=A0A915HWK9_ROMCU
MGPEVRGGVGRLFLGRGPAFDLFMEDYLKNFCALFRRYIPNFADSIAASQLENKFEVFYYNLTSNTVDLSLITNVNVIYSEIYNEFCSQCCSLIIDQRCSRTLLERTISTLHNLAWKSIPIRNYFQHSTTLSSSVSICLISLGEEYNQKLFCLCLKLYQLLTYNDHDESYHNFNVDSSNIQDLVFHLASLACKHSQSTQSLPDDVDLLPPSLAVLNNLCVISKIRSYLASSVKFRDAIIKLLRHSKTSIVIGSLCLLMKLNDRIVCKNVLSHNSNYFASSECKVGVNDLKILIDESLKCPLETSCPFLAQKCSKIYHALQLTKVMILNSDTETRADIVNTVNPALCRHIFEFQAMSNPLLFTNSSSNVKKELPLWW